MDVFEAVRTLLAVRRYQDRPVPEAVLHRIVEAGRLTASAKNMQPWDFIVVQDRETLRQLGAVARTGPYVAQAPLAIVVAVDKTPFAVSDASRAIQSMLLTAWADGVGSNWVGFLGWRKSRPSSRSRPSWMCWRSFRSATRSKPWDEARSSANCCGRSPTENGTASPSSREGDSVVEPSDSNRGDRRC
jgi:hypothetical protein